MRTLWCVPICISWLACWCIAQDAPTPKREDRSYPPKLPDATAVYTYKKASDAELKLWVYAPAEHKPTDRSPAIVFFFGGGWKNGSPSQFQHQCRYLASRGMVAITADSRVSSRNPVKPVDCVRDAKSAIRWVRSHASELGVDPEKIVASGGSAGGHIAACAGTLKEFDEQNENLTISSRPNAMVLFNPALAFDSRREPAAEQIETLLGVQDPKRLTPADHVTAETPMTLILFGSKDPLLLGGQRFVDEMKKLGTRCELDITDGAGHGFFNYGRDGNTAFLKTMTATDKFLTSLGYLQGEPKVEEFFASK